MNDMILPVQEILLTNDDEVDRILMPLVRKRVFHSTTEEGYLGIIEQGAVLSARDSNIKRQWPNAPSLFYERGYVSFWDYYHPNQEKIDENIFKQTFYRHGKNRVTNLLMLKEDFFVNLATWKDFTLNDRNGKKIVPHIESGLKAPVSISCFKEVIKIILHPTYFTF